MMLFSSLADSQLMHYNCSDCFFVCEMIQYLSSFHCLILKLLIVGVICVLHTFPALPEPAEKELAFCKYLTELYTEQTANLFVSG